MNQNQLDSSEIIAFNSQPIQHYITGNITVPYTGQLDGGGKRFNVHFINYLQSVYPDRKFENCLEWCSGPGFVGFAVYSQGLCDNIHFCDIYPPVQECMQLAQQLNSEHADRIFFYLSDGLTAVPKHTKFDLIVGNPPMFNTDPYHYTLNRQRRYKDHNWETHERFFNEVEQHLTDQGVVLLTECIWGSGVATFQPLLEKTNLSIKNHKQIENTALWMMEIGKTKIF